MMRRPLHFHLLRLAITVMLLAAVHACDAAARRGTRALAAVQGGARAALWHERHTARPVPLPMRSSTPVDAHSGRAIAAITRVIGAGRFCEPSRMPLRGAELRWNQGVQRLRAHRAPTFPPIYTGAAPVVSPALVKSPKPPCMGCQRLSDLPHAHLEVCARVCCSTTFETWSQ